MSAKLFSENLTFQSRSGDDVLDRWSMVGGTQRGTGTSSSVDIIARDNKVGRAPLVETRKRPEKINCILLPDVTRTRIRKTATTGSSRNQYRGRMMYVRMDWNSLDDER